MFPTLIASALVVSFFLTRFFAGAFVDIYTKVCSFLSVVRSGEGFLCAFRSHGLFWSDVSAGCVKSYPGLAESWK